MLTTGNTKTGRQVHLFNLPRKTTCPGRTAYCDEVCYAKWWDVTYPPLKLKYKLHLKQTQQEAFVDNMVDEIQKKNAKVVRWHSSGDFYSAEYADKWVEIAKACPDVIFYGYTRSWNVEDILPSLKKLAKIPNVQLWWSFDKSMPEPPEGHRAYMAMDDNDIAPYDADLIFRVQRDTIVFTQGDVVVCPHEDGQYSIKNNPLKCYTCEVCFKEAHGT